MTIKTRNPASGFYGTIRAKQGDARAEEAWDVAHAAISAAIPGALPTEVRNYLDSEFGVYTANDVLAGITVAHQLEFRLSRLRRNFARVQIKEQKE